LKGSTLNSNLEQEPEEGRGLNRRKFLEIFGKGLVGAVVLSSGCAVRGIGLKNEAINRGLERFPRELEDPNNYLRYLKDREFVVKNEIFDAYINSIYVGSRLGNVEGTYMSKNYLDKKEEIKEFRERLTKLGLLEDEISFYESLFTSSDIIILPESILKTKKFLKILPHERFHKKIQCLSNGEYKMMKQAAQEIMGREDEEENMRFVRERYYEGKEWGGGSVTAAVMNWEEFYTRLAQGEFEDFVEQAFEDDYPEEYKIFLEIKESCKLSE